jgi:hypothetical protein
MPFPGGTFKVTANEQTIGLGTITVLESSFLYESGNQGHVGFDLNALRLVRVTNTKSFDVAYSVQGSIQKVSFTTVPRYIRKNEGIEKDITTNPFEWDLAFWKLHTITGAVVGRIVADKADAPIDGANRLPEEAFGNDFSRANALIEGLPYRDKSRSEENQSRFEHLSVQLDQEILKFTDSWLMGSLSLGQREKVAALCYLSNARKSERGWITVESETKSPNESEWEFGESANEWIEEESLWGSNLKSIVQA